MVGCSIRNCKSKSIKGGTIRFFSFPRKESVANEWLRYCGPKTTAKNGRVCSKHFLSSDYFKSLRHILLNESPRKVRTLKPDALPTLLIDDTSKSNQHNLSMPIEVNSQIVDSSGNMKTTADTLAVDNKNELSEITLKKNAGKCRRYRERKKAEVQQLLALNNDQEPSKIILKKKQNAKKSRRFREQQRIQRTQQQQSTFIQEHKSPFEEVPPTPTSIRQIKLHQESTENFKEDIINGDELHAEHINNFQDIIASRFLNLRPIDVQLIALPQFVRPISHLQKHLQILSGVSAQVNQTTHWICTYYDGNFINVYDSLNTESLYPEMISLLNQLLPHKPQHKFHKVRQQLNDTDSGVYAIAFATSLLNNRDPAKENYDYPKMRSHLLDIYNTTELLPFPIEPSADALRKRKKNKVQFQLKEHSAAALHKRKIRALQKLEAHQRSQNVGGAQPLSRRLPERTPTDSSSKSKSSSSQIKMPAPIRHTPFIKSESQVDIKQDPDSEDTLSLDGGEDPPSDADQPFEDMMPLSNVPLTNAQDPLSEVKVKKEVPDAPPDEMIIKVEEEEVAGPGEEEMGPEEEETCPGEEETSLGEEEISLGEEEASLVEEETGHVKEDWDTKLLRTKIAKLTARWTAARRRIKNMTQILKRRDNTIRRLRAERDQLTNCIVGRGGTVGGTRAGKIQIQSTNNTATEMKPNRKVVVIKRVPNRSESSANTQHTTSANIGRTSPTIQDTSENVGDKRTLNIVERSALGIRNTSDILYKTLTGVKRTADVQKSPIGGQHTLDNRQKPSIVVEPLSDAVKTPTFVIQPNADRQIPSVISSVQNTSEKRKKLSIVVKPVSEIGKRPIVVQPKSENRKISSIGVQQKSVNRPKPIVIKRMSCIKNPKFVVQPKSVTRKMSVDLQRTLEIQQNSSLVVQPTSDNQPTSSLVVQSSPDNRTVSSLAVQPTSENRPMPSLAVQRTSDIRQNSLVIQIDGMHNTVLQPKLVRLADKQTEMET